jgi:hypothetical protein
MGRGRFLRKIEEERPEDRWLRRPTCVGDLAGAEDRKVFGVEKGRVQKALALNILDQ